MAKWLDNDCKIITLAAGERKLLCHYGCFFHPKVFRCIRSESSRGNISNSANLKTSAFRRISGLRNIDYFNIAFLDRVWNSFGLETFIGSGTTVPQ
jgi:hypothetical protein